MKTHVQQTASRCFVTLRQLRSIRRCIPTSVFNSLISALVLISLDYCNSLLIDLTLTHIQRLQSVQNAEARLIFNLRRCDHIIDVLISLHWLHVTERIIFKVATLTYRALHGSAPPYLASSFTCVADMPHRRRLRSASTEQLDVPTCRRSTIGGQRSCLSCCWSKGVEWPVKRCYVDLVAVGVQEQAEEILLLLLLRNCFTLTTFPFLVIISPPEQWSLQ